MPTLREALPSEFHGPGYEESWAVSHLWREVIAEHDARIKPWPGKHRNVRHWWELAGGYGVGWNENPSRGWSFPVVNLNRKQTGIGE